MPEDTRVSMPIKMKSSLWRRLALLQAALEEKMGKKMSRDDLVEQIVEDFLNSK